MFSPIFLRTLFELSLLAAPPPQPAACVLRSTHATPRTAADGTAEPQLRRSDK